MSLSSRAYLLLVSCVFLAVGCDSQLTAPTSEETSTQATSPASTDAGPKAGPKGPSAPEAACDVTVAPSSSIDEVVDNTAQPGDLVCVESGTYTEQVTINKNLTLRGIDSPTIQMPSKQMSPGPEAFTISESGPTWEPVVFAFGGTESEGKVSGSGTVDVTVKGFTIDGANQQPKEGHNRAVALFYRNASGTVHDNRVENMAIGGKETFGILAYGDSDVEITDNTINGYERGGIGANGDNGQRPDPEVLISGNTVTGSGDGSRTSWGPNGIQVGYGATGRITENTVKTNRYASSFDGAASAGIIVFGSSGVMVRGNEVANSDIHLAAAAGKNNKFVRNETEDAIIGAYFASARNGKLVNNVFSDPEGGPNGAVGVLNTGENNKLINNRIGGFDTPVQDLGTDSKVQANSKPATP